jgi:transmembrane 9 superfamily protein 2/4
VFLLMIVWTVAAANKSKMKNKRKNKRKKAKERKEAFQQAKTEPRNILASKEQLSEKTFEKIQEHKRLNRNEKKEIDKVEIDTYKELRAKGYDEVSNTKEAKMMRNYRLRNKKKGGLFRKNESSLAQILFPGVSPEDYVPGEKIWMYTDLVESRLTPVPFDVYDLPGYYEEAESRWLKKQRLRRNLGSRMLGHDLKPAPFHLEAKNDVPCTVFGKSYIGSKELQWLRQLVERQYRVHLQLDTLPVLLKSHELNFALRGYPIGFKLPDTKELFLYNHLKFTITYHESAGHFQGIRITGFEVHPVSTKHDKEANTCQGFDVENQGDKVTFVSLESELGSTPVIFSYDVKWVSNEDLVWSDRWDVYLVGAPDDDIHYYSIVNSLMIVLVMTAAIATIMIRTLRNDIAGYNELVDLEEEEEETGWKLVHGDVFRPPSYYPMALSVLVGTGAQIGVAAFAAIICAVLHITNAMNKGQMLTSLILCYVLCGSVAGYVSSRIFKLSKGTAWKLNTIYTATALPSVCVTIFAVLNIFLSVVHAASSVSFLTICVLFLLWVCVSTPLVFMGAFVGLRGNGIETTCRTNSIARIVPDSIPFSTPVLSAMLGGILPFGSVCIELAFIMSALWLHQIYYVMGFLLAVGVVLTATCAQVSIVMTYLQLCAEDHRWWWKSFWNCASGGVYVFLYSIWFLASRLQIVGALPLIIYVTYMSMISVFFGIFCGSAGFLSSLWFTKRIYGSVKVD